jgi:hypothetical protein
MLKPVNAIVSLQTPDLNGNWKPFSSPAWHLPDNALFQSVPANKRLFEVDPIKQVTQRIDRHLRHA